MSTFWNGRFDGDTEEHLRIFQIVTSHALADIQLNTQMQNNSYQIIGFRCDEGVRRNKG